MAEFILIDEHANKYGDSKKAMPVYIAPLVAFTGPPEEITSEHRNKLQAAAVVSLPDHWNIRTQGTRPGEKKPRGRSFEPVVRNQLQCGSCWAHAIAGVASDFLSLYRSGGEISVTSVMLNSGKTSSDLGANTASPLFPKGAADFNMGCCGGDPRAAVRFLASSLGLPIAFESCNDYTWMRRVCNGETSIGGQTIRDPGAQACIDPITKKPAPGLNYFNRAASQFLTGSVDGGIYSDEELGAQGCYYGDQKHSMVRLSPNPTFTMGSDDKLQATEYNLTHFNSGQSSNPTVKLLAILKNQKLMKHHLYTVGSLVGVFSVLNDFVLGSPGSHLKNLPTADNKLNSNSWRKMGGNKGYVYMENRNEAKVAGSHAVILMGWDSGIVDGNTIPYWIVRNSWGTKWNNGGYFNIAMYPINILSQFSREWHTYECDDPTNNKCTPVIANGTVKGGTPGRGYSGVFVGFGLGLVASQKVPTLPGWEKMTDSTLKKELEPAKCNALDGKSLDSWVSFHKTDKHESFGKQSDLSNSGSKDAGNAILDFFKKYGIAIGIIALIIFFIVVFSR